MFGGNKTIFEKDKLTFERNNTTSEKHNLMSDKTNPVIKENDIVSKQNLAGQDDGGKNWKSSRGPRIISIEKIDNRDSREILAERIKEKASRKDYPEIKETKQDKQLKKRKLNVLPNSEERRQEDKRTEENKVEGRDQRVQNIPQKTVIN